MDAASVELVRRAYAAWNLGDWGTLLGLADPNIEWRPALGTSLEGATVYYGPEGVRAYRDEVEAMLGRISSEPTEILRATPEHVIVRTHVRGRGADSGIEVDQHFVHAWTIREGRIAAMRSFASERDALAAVGPSTRRRPSRDAAARRRPGEAARARPDA
jgi:ketosteroid isomerase-like protein